MEEKKDILEDGLNNDLEEGQDIEEAFAQMELLYRSRCVQAPTGSNVTVREIEKDK